LLELNSFFLFELIPPFFPPKASRPGRKKADSFLFSMQSNLSVQLSLR